MAHVFQMKTKPHGFQRYDEFIRDQVIGIGWPLIGNLDGISKDELRERLRNVYHYSGAKLGNALGAIWAFVHTMEQGDIVLVRNGAWLSIGIIGPYRYVKHLDNDLDGFCHQRSVEWKVMNENVRLYNEKVHETLRHPGVVTKSKYPVHELQLGI
ncbi:hypothetical protein [Geobacillus thermoleovorans]|uniref:hypothetical protein n=1 Tax=Geobacillus thermoleovorans TaxID=33941 RepID=UPI003DA281E2